MIFYGGLSKKRVLKIHSFVLEKREQLGFGQRRLFKLVRKRFSVEIKESTISGWIFRDIIPFEQEKTQFRPKPKLSKTVLFNLYFKKKISPDTIGEKYTVSGNTVRKWIIDYGGKTRTLTESMNSSITKKLLREQKLFIPKKSFSFIDPTIAYIVGVLCGDGHINPKHITLEIRYDTEFIKEFLDCVNEVYATNYDYYYYKPKNSYITHIASQVICQDFLSFSKYGTEEWLVPEEILNSKDELVMGSFLRGFYDSEGHVARSSVSSSSINYKGLKQTQYLLEKLGIKTTFKPIKGGKYWNLSIFRKQRFKIFREKVGFTIKRKQEDLNELLKNDIYYKEA